MPLRAMLCAVAFVFFAVIALPADRGPLARASTADAPLDLEQAQAAGARLREALALGRAGRWAEAEALAARGGDRLLRDLVLWRKLAAGAGSLSEFDMLFQRRPGWPGRDAIARRILGPEPGTRGPALSGAAAANWSRIGRLIDEGRGLEAAHLLDRLADDPAKRGPALLWTARRQLLARHALRAGEPRLAYAIAARHGVPRKNTGAFAELEWLAGWTALVGLRAPERALAHFRRFASVVATPISLGRAGYWTGRALDALGRPAEAERAYAEAARHQTSFYGQLAAARLGIPGDRALITRQLADWSKTPALRSDDVRAALLLHFAGEEPLALEMLARVGRALEGGGALAGLAALGLDLDRPHYAIRVAKEAARKGVLLPAAYYPVTELARHARRIEPALALAIARQETELNPRAISRAGARGLMQLMPGTARKVARDLGEPYSLDRLIEDWRYNARLGEAYLAEQIETFGGSYVLAAAAYNAGPHRVARWLEENGDPYRSGAGVAEVVDWIEMIPFSETRNYVQRVIEALYVYRARLDGEVGAMTIEHDLMRGPRG